MFRIQNGKHVDSTASIQGVTPMSFCFSLGLIQLDEMNAFEKEIISGIPSKLPAHKPLDLSVPHAPKRQAPLNESEKKLSVNNALRYFPKKFHSVLSKEFFHELETYGHIYMYRFRPNIEIKARSLNEYPAKLKEARAIQLMIQNNLDPRVAQYPHELITYGGNGAVFQNWAQYLLTMKYLSIMNDHQTLVMYSGHPLGLFPSSPWAPRVVVTNGMVVPNYSSKEDLNRFYALGVSQYGQMTAGSYMYIGPQGIVHGTTITLLNAKRLKPKGKHLLFVSSGLGGMSGAQTKAAKMAGLLSVIAEIKPDVVAKRMAQGWGDEVFTDLGLLVQRIRKGMKNKEAVSIIYNGNVVDLWEKLVCENIDVDIGTDQTSLHNPEGGGYYPVSQSIEVSNQMLVNDPVQFREKVESSLKRQVKAINALCGQGMSFFDYGNAFLLESKKAQADILTGIGDFKYPSYVEHIMGPKCFDLGFGPFRWVCLSNKEKDLLLTDKIAADVLKKCLKNASKEVQEQLQDNIHWIENAHKNKLVVGSQARILYAHSEGRIKIAKAFNKAIRNKRISSAIVLGRDHHDVSGTDSPYRETANIYDGSKFTADMSIHTVIGNAFRGASWVSIHNGGGVGFGEAINGGFGMVLMGSKTCDEKIESMLFWDVNNGISRRSWAGNKGAQKMIQREMKQNKNLCVTIPFETDEEAF